jgi:DNA-binding NarL/FixJ family response regulator
MSTEERTDVFVVDDHAVVRVGVRSFLEGTGRFRVVAEASSLTEARMRMSTLPESVTLLIADMQLKGGSGIDIIREARLREPPLEVIVLTSFPSARILRRALAIGARGFVLKEAGVGALLEALVWAQKGHVYLDPRLGEAIVDALVFPDNVDRQASEERLLTLLADGLTDRDIARILSKPQATVSRDISLLLKRMGVTSRAAAVSTALRRGLLV